MAFSMKLVASELLMCGLRNLPLVGTAVEVVDGVRSRHEMLAHADRLTAAEEKLTRMERGLRDLVVTEIRTALDNLSRPNLNGPALTQEIRNLQEIRAQGWEPALFEGLLANSSHWEELQLNPQNYGKILSDRDVVSRDSIPVLIEAESTRVLELTPYAFSQLLAGQAVGTPKAKIVTAQDVWALPVVVVPPQPFSVPTFSRWPETPGVMNGASKNCIRLNRLSGITDEDWTLLEPLRFWLVNRGTSTHTFGYVRSELPEAFRGPLARWIAAAKGRGKGSEVRRTTVGEVVRVNIDARSIEILGGGTGGGIVV